MRQQSEDAMSPALRRLFYVLTYEAFGICVAAVGLMLISGRGSASVGLVAAIGSVVAMAWNYVFNAIFEAWERRQVVKGRSVARRIAHALGFELGLVVLLTPVIAFALGVTLYEALAYDAVLIGVFIAYTFLFNLCFDRLFGLPQSAKA